MPFFLTMLIALNVGGVCLGMYLGFCVVVYMNNLGYQFMLV
jgi:hypothetical protein